MMEVEAVTASPVDKRSDQRTMALLAVAGAMLAVLIYTVVAQDQAATCPSELIGAWETSTKGYEQGMLVFTKTGVAFNVGDDHLDAQAVRRLETIPEGSRTLYTVTYGDSHRDEQTLSFYYHAKEQTITFKNQSHLVWTRKAVES
ncbi:MAG: hypothetical protein A4E19_03500 [Nitrospira sp. SG-bin1]|nr:MAG: hypothetical protein A4E19_03500 [Nitrospira sp. SG-bin1]